MDLLNLPKASPYERIEVPYLPKSHYQRRQRLPRLSTAHAINGFDTDSRFFDVSSILWQDHSAFWLCGGMFHLGVHIQDSVRRENAMYQDCDAAGVNCSVDGLLRVFFSVKGGIFWNMNLPLFILNVAIFWGHRDSSSSFRYLTSSCDIFRSLSSVVYKSGEFGSCSLPVCQA